MRADVVALPLDSVEQRVDLLVGQRVRPAELRVEVARVVADLGQRIGDLIVELHLFVGEVLHGDPRRLPERHRPIAVERAARVDRNRQGVDLRVAAPARCEEVAHRRLHRRRRLTVPVDAQDRKAPVAGRGHPDVLNGTGPPDVGDGEHLFRFDEDRRRDLPAAS